VHRLAVTAPLIDLSHNLPGVIPGTLPNFLLERFRNTPTKYTANSSNIPVELSARPDAHKAKKF
jgi:hypothetical protein